MQWLINIIKFWANSSFGFFDRGDASTYDFTSADFTADNAWHDLDLSGIVPTDTAAVLLICRVRHGFIPSAFRFRKNGNVNARNMPVVAPCVSNVYSYAVITVFCDDSSVIEYRCSAGPWLNADFTVSGWWLRPS